MHALEVLEREGARDPHVRNLRWFTSLAEYLVENG